MNKSLRKLFGISIALMPVLCSAQFTDIYNCNFPGGAEPFGSLNFDAKGKMYNSAYMGGAHDTGCIFSVNSDGTGYKDIFDFSGANGSGPNSPLILINSRLYGTTSFGGAHDSGCIFSLDTNGSGYVDMFDFSGADGKNPYNALVYSNGILYGVADGGPNEAGVLFSIDTAGTSFRDLYNFVDSLGQYPLGLTMNGNKFYGSTFQGGKNTYGTVFSIDTGGTNYNDLYNCTIANGYWPGGPVSYKNGMLFGTTGYGGLNTYGTLFSLDTNGSNFKIIYNFNNVDGAQPNYAGGALLFSGSRLYGTCFNGGAHDSGCVFSIDSNGTGYKDLHDFTGADGKGPEGSLTFKGYLLYGATAYGGTNHNGVLFAWDTNKPVIHAASDTVCQGDTALLWVSGLTPPTTYLWSPGIQSSDSVHEIISVTTTYTVQSTQGFSQYTGYYTVTASSQAPPVISGTKTKCKGKTDTLTVSGGNHYLWNNGSTGNIYITGAIMADSVIRVTAFNAFGCSDTASFVILVDTLCNQGIEALQAAGNGISIFPNPNNGIFQLAISEQLSANNQIEIYNMLGEKVYSDYQIIKSSNYQIDLSTKPSGVYLYRVTNGAGNLLGEGKFVIAK